MSRQDNHRTIARHVAAVVAMVAGTTFVFALLYTMNELGDRPEREEKVASTEFAVEKKKKEKKKLRPKKKRKAPVRTETVRRAPPPNLSTQLSGLSFDLPAFQTDNLLSTDGLLATSNSDAPLVMTEDSVDALPKPRSRVSPQYPAGARKRGIEGHVVLKLRVNERGEVARVRVLEAQPVGVFEEVAVAAVEKWVFDPATYQGAAVAISVSQRIPFRLN